MEITLEKGSKYLAHVRLSWLQRIASNDVVVEKFRSLGFSDVLSVGSGNARAVSGTWGGDTSIVDVPDSIVEVIKIG